MANPTLFVSYDQNGKKLSFANWISVLSPQDTPFVSMTGKESINQTIFSWQTDALASVDGNNAHVEGSRAPHERWRCVDVDPGHRVPAHPHHRRAGGAAGAARTPPGDGR